MFIGYILNNAFSLDKAGWQDILDLVVENLCIKQGVFTYTELLEG
ncbi:MAG: hypothetical protein ACMG6E_04365 [Candidatus Roizmanbacteria bacterium]